MRGEHVTHRKDIIAGTYLMNIVHCILSLKIKESRSRVICVHKIVEIELTFFVCFSNIVRLKIAFILSLVASASKNFFNFNKHSSRTQDGQFFRKSKKLFFCNH